MNEQTQNPENRIALYVAGDEHIAGPSLVCLHSFRMHNPSLDVYLITRKEHVSQKILESINQIGIRIIDSASLPDIPIELNSPANKPPREVYYNYYAPIILLQMGYRYSIKVDYDTLCIRPLSIEQILPRGATYAGNRHFMDLKRMLKDVEFIASSFAISEDDMAAKATNVGVLVIDNEEFVRLGVYQTMCGVVQRCDALGREWTDVSHFIDQPVFRIAEIIDTRVIKQELSPDYNWLVQHKSFIGRSTRIIHYVTPHKPWKDLPSRTDQYRQGLVLAYRRHWVKHYFRNPVLHVYKPAWHERPWSETAFRWQNTLLKPLITFSSLMRRIRRRLSSRRR